MHRIVSSIPARVAALAKQSSFLLAMHAPDGTAAYGKRDRLTR